MSLGSPCGNQRVRDLTTRRASRRRSLIDLPHEILAEVFEVGYCGPEESRHRSKSQIWSPPTYRRFCLAVSWTCSTLRYLIIRTRKCWSHISIYADSNVSPDGMLQLASLFLLRSNPHTFDLIVAVGHWDGWSDENEEDPFWETLRAHAHRCRSISYERPEDFGEPFILSSTFFEQVELPSLQLLHFSHGVGEDDGGYGGPYEYDDRGFPEQLSSLRLSETRLTALSLDCPSGRRYRVLLPTFSLASLERLRINADVRKLPFPETLYGCPALEHLSWSCDPPRHGAPTPQVEPLVLLLLRSLELVGAAATLFPPILTAPSLEQVIVDSNSDHTGGPRFIHHPASSFPLLRRLSASAAFLTGEIVAGLLDRCQNLAELCVSDYSPKRDSGLPDAILRSITLPRDFSGGVDSDSPGARYGQSLRTVPFYFELGALSIYAGGTKRTVQDVFLDLSSVEARLLGVPRLQIRLLNVSEPKEASDVSALADSLANGQLVFPNRTRREQWDDPWANWWMMCNYPM